MRKWMYLGAMLLLAPPVGATEPTPEIRDAVIQKLVQGAYLTSAAAPEQAVEAALAIYQGDWEMPVTGVLTSQLADHILGKTAATASQFIQSQQGCGVYSERPSAREAVSWTGACADGRATGTGTLYWTFTHGGEAKETSYFGAMKGGKMHGTGTYLQANGWVYTGAFQDDRIHGEGVLIGPSGVFMQGTFANHLLNGRAVVAYKDGLRYEGDLVDSRFQGQGTLTWADGDSYQGAFSQGAPHGQGTASLGEKTATGTWDQGCFTGDPTGKTFIFASEEACAQP